MTLMTFGSEEEIMCKGEPASWTGVVLEGKLEARDGKKVFGSISPGNICGEIAIFHGGLRNAGVVGVKEGSMAVIMINELQRLYFEHPDIGVQLVRLFGQAIST